MPAASGRLTAEQIKLDAQVYASPIVVGSTVFVATERNSVYAISPSGTTKWSVNLGVATRRSSLPCGNIDPLGITGTPIYDAATSTLFATANRSVVRMTSAIRSWS